MKKKGDIFNIFLCGRECQQLGNVDIDKQSLWHIEGVLMSILTMALERLSFHRSNF